MQDYEVDVGIYDYGWSHRCDVCDLACSSKRGVAIHKSRAHKNGKTQNFLGTLADKTVMTCKIIEQQKERPKIKCGGRELDHVFRSKYLGSVFTADADQDHDINARIARPTPGVANCAKFWTPPTSRSTSSYDCVKPQFAPS